MPQPLSAFKSQLLQSVEIRKLLADEFGPESEAAVRAFQAGAEEYRSEASNLRLDLRDVWDLIDDKKIEMSDGPEETIDGAAPDDDVFGIEIHSIGPVYWIRANEFDDIGYFPSLAKARAHAEEVFEGFITELNEREEDS